MADDTPLSEKTAPGDSASLKQLTLAVQLQVWHYRSREQDPEFSNYLVSLFQKQKLQEWDVAPPDDVGLDERNDRDRFCAAEVSNARSPSITDQ
jgi:hypothetical protein